MTANLGSAGILPAYAYVFFSGNLARAFRRSMQAGCLHSQVCGPLPAANFTQRARATAR